MQFPWVSTQFYTSWKEKKRNENQAKKTNYYRRQTPPNEEQHKTSLKQQLSQGQPSDQLTMWFSILQLP